MISSFKINNFKSYKTASLPLAPLTVMIGANASGKSNAIEALRFVSWLAQGQRLSSIQYSVNSGEQIVRGTVRNLPNTSNEPFGFECSISGFGLANWEVAFEVREDGLHIVKESLSQPWENVSLYWLDRPSTDRGTDVGVAYNNFARGGKKPHVTCIDQMAIFLQLMSPTAFSSEHRGSRTRIPRITQQLEVSLSNILFLDPNPHLMRSYSFPADEKLRGDGSNISAVLFNLCGRPEHDLDVSESVASTVTDSSEELLNLIKSLPEQDIVGIGFIREPRGGVMVELMESFGHINRKFDASLLSDGTLRVLSIAAALLSAPEGTMVVIEEIDNGVHPSRAKHLLECIRRIAEDRKLRVVMSTHNPALLDALPDESIPDVVFCYRDTEDGSSKLLRLSDSRFFSEIVAQDTLGGLLTSGLLDRYAKLKSTAESRKQSARNWLSNIR